MFKFKFSEVALSIGLVIIIISGFPMLAKEWNKNKPIENWFNIRQLEIAPITPIGEYPKVVFDRIVLQSFNAVRSVEVQKVSGESFLRYCHGTGNRIYTLESKLIGQGESTEWFSKTFPDCLGIKDSAGKYRVVVTWTIDRGKFYYPYKLEKISNVFEIIDPETFIPSKTQESINKTSKEMEAFVETQKPTINVETPTEPEKQ